MQNYTNYCSSDYWVGRFDRLSESASCYSVQAYIFPGLGQLPRASRSKIGLFWDRVNNTGIGTYSGELGQNNNVSAVNSFALGLTNTITTSSTSASIALGNGNFVSQSNSLAAGNMSMATGSNSIALGNMAVAGGSNSFATGSNTIAGGTNSVAFNASTTGTGTDSAAFGKSTKADAFADFVIGQFNNTGSYNLTSWPTASSDPVFEIGNGTSSVHANALTVLKNGNATFTGADIEMPAQAYVNGYSVVTCNVGDGRYLSQTPSTLSLTTVNTIAMGYSTSATGSNSVSVGDSTTANGFSSLCHGIRHYGFWFLFGCLGQ